MKSRVEKKIRRRKNSIFVSFFDYCETTTTKKLVSNTEDKTVVVLIARKKKEKSLEVFHLLIFFNFYIYIYIFRFNCLKYIQHLTEK